MDIKVMKFGGTSLKNEKTRAYVYRHIVKNLTRLWLWFLPWDVIRIPTLRIHFFP